MEKKKKFIELMNKLVNIKKCEDDLNEAFLKFDPDFNYISFGQYETLVVDSLKMAVNDKYDWIVYWLYECNCGKNSKILNSVKDKKGKKIPIKTLSNLYDLIVSDK
jgi:hypothetical protein